MKLHTLLILVSLLCLPALSSAITNNTHSDANIPLSVLNSFIDKVKSEEKVLIKTLAEPYYTTTSKSAYTSTLLDKTEIKIDKDVYGYHASVKYFFRWYCDSVFANEQYIIADYALLDGKKWRYTRAIRFIEDGNPIVKDPADSIWILRVFRQI
jgi:hypothetical protein